jgi:hypothetical protein
MVTRSVHRIISSGSEGAALPEKKTNPASAQTIEGLTFHQNGTRSEDQRACFGGVARD